jgi:hypothetical protein
MVTPHSAWRLLEVVHVYDKDAKPHFHLTPAQAKKQGMYFSVTEHQKILAKPALEGWKIGEHLKTAFNNPPQNGEDIDAFIKRIRAFTWKNSGGAAELGSQIHEGLESVLNGSKKVEDLDVSLRKYVAPAIRYFTSKNFEILDLEKVVVNVEEGYGGTVDCAAKTDKGLKFILDWKSRKTSGRKIKPYGGQPEQCAAYGAAYFGHAAIEGEEVWGANAYISTDEFDKNGESRFEVVSYTPKEMRYHWETFKLTAELWRRSENYDPRNN